MDSPKTNREKITEAQILLDFYIDLIERSKNLIKYYLSDDVVLDWFGQTIRGQKEVAAFLKMNVFSVKHFFQDATPVNKIGYRDTHVVRASRPARRILRSSFSSPPRLSLLNTPKKQPQPSTSSKRQSSRKTPQTDKSNNNNNDKSRIDNDLSESPRKKSKLLEANDTDVLEGETDVSDVVRVKYLTADGHVEFHRPSLKKLQKETKWQRPCKLHVAYDSGKDVKDSSFYLIIYEGNVKCRRNLMKDFEAEESEN